MASELRTGAHIPACFGSFLIVSVKNGSAEQDFHVHTLSKRTQLSCCCCQKTTSCCGTRVLHSMSLCG